MTDPVAFIEALADGGAPEPVRHASQSPAALYARSRSRISSRWYHRVLAFVVFALVPAVPLFRLHQWITYGGTFGEYYVYGWNAYLLGFAVYWGSACVNLVLYAAVLRALAEPIVWTVAHLAPARTERVRRVVEVADRILYYGGVPVLLMRIFLS